jgi:hypothetical protein
MRIMGAAQSFLAPEIREVLHHDHGLSLLTLVEHQSIQALFMYAIEAPYK